MSDGPLLPHLTATIGRIRLDADVLPQEIARATVMEAAAWVEQWLEDYLLCRSLAQISELPLGWALGVVRAMRSEITDEESPDA